ncbi:MAG: long-chain fatty acid--CoA ligase [Peptococcaceae bacterium]|nr:long-chain fatty acid--CoA ligase [Peptococcaceae bacterium]
MNLPLKLLEQCQLSPEKDAIVYYDQKITYKELGVMINTLTNSLYSLGIKPDDRVILALENCPEFIVSYYAIMKVKGIVVPVNPHFTVKEYQAIIQDTKPSAIFTDKILAPVFNDLADKISAGYLIVDIDSDDHFGHVYSYKKICRDQSKEYSLPTITSRHDVVELMYSTGTSGTSKGAMLTHHNLYRNAITFAHICSLTSLDRSLLIAPAYYATGQTCVMNATLLVGGTLIIQEGWKGPTVLLETIQNERISFYFAPPTIYALLLTYPDIDKYNLSTWRIALTGAAPTPADVSELFEKKFGIRLIEGYGMTETSPMVTLMPPDGPAKPGSIGLPLPGVQVKIVDYEDREVTSNQIGEIVVRGHNVMKGYYLQPEETSCFMRNGWFHTGDLGYYDNDGYLYIVDRKKDLIIKGDLHISPREVENALYSHPAIYDTAVTGIPDSVMGEEVLAFVLLKEGNQATPEEIKHFCEDKLAHYKIPKYIRFVKNLPKTTSGKLLRGELRKMI